VNLFCIEIFPDRANYICIILAFSPLISIQSITQEIFIKGLANSKTFQKFAVHTDRHLNKIKKEGVETLNTHIDEIHKQATKAAFSTSAKESSSGATGSGGKVMPPTKPLEGVAGFFSALGKVIRRDLGMGK